MRFLIIQLYSHCKIEMGRLAIKLNQKSPFLSRVLIHVGDVFLWPVEKMLGEAPEDIKHDRIYLKGLKEEFLANMPYLLQDATEEQHERMIEKLKREGVAKVFPRLKEMVDLEVMSEAEVIEVFETQRWLAQHRKKYHPVMK